MATKMYVSQVVVSSVSFAKQQEKERKEQEEEEQPQQRATMNEWMDGWPGVPPRPNE